MVTKKFLTVLFLPVFLSACTSLVAVPEAADEDAPMQVSMQEIHILRPGDTLKLTVYGEETLTGKYQVNSEGFINIPLLGKVRAQGVPIEKLQGDVATQLQKQGYLTNPHITLDVDSVRPVYVMGEVRNPGKYEWQPDLTVFQAIASAGGYTPRAAQNMVLIDRGKRLNANEQTPVLPGDSIIVRERIF